MLVELTPGALITVNAAAWLSIQLALAAFYSRIRADRLPMPNHVSRVHGWERSGAAYERLFRIKAWKQKLPDGAVWFRGGTSKRHLRSGSREELTRFATETWRGELVHWLAICALPLFAIWNGGAALAVNALYAITANIPCILVQRYNRSRISRVLERKARAAARTSSTVLGHETSRSRMLPHL